MLGVCSDLKKVCGVAQARVTSEPKVAGSNPAAGESRRSSVVEHWAVSGRKFPPQKKPGWCGTEILRHQWKAGPSASHSGHLFLPV